MGHLPVERTFKRPRAVGFGHDLTGRIDAGEFADFRLIYDIRREGNVVAVFCHTPHRSGRAFEPMEMGPLHAVPFKQTAGGVGILVYRMKHHRLVMFLGEGDKPFQQLLVRFAVERLVPSSSASLRV